MEETAQDINLDTFHELAAASSFHPASDREQQQFTDPLAVRFQEVLPKILSTSLISRRILPRPNCVIQPERLQLLDDCISNSVTDSSDLWILNCSVYTAAYVLLESMDKLKCGPYQFDKQQKPLKDEVSLVRSDLARVSNELFRMRTNLRSRTKKEDTIKRYLQDKYRVSVWNTRNLKALHESLIQMLKVATTRSNYNKSRASARKPNSQFVSKVCL